MLAAVALACLQWAHAFVGVPLRQRGVVGGGGLPQRQQQLVAQRRQQRLALVVRRRAAAAASGPEGDGGGDGEGSAGSGMDEAGSELGGRYDGWGSDAAGSRGYAEEGSGSMVADRVQEQPEEEEEGEDPEEAALKERVLRRVAELRREQAAAGGLLAEALNFDGAPDADLGIEPLPRSGQANRAFKVFDSSAGDGEGSAVFVKFADVVPGLDGKATLTKNRLRSEFHGYEELAKVGGGCGDGD